MNKQQRKWVKNLFTICFLFFLLSAPFIISAVETDEFRGSANRLPEEESGALGGPSQSRPGVNSGFIPCGNIKNADGVIQNPCEPCHIFILGENILNFLWWKISIPIATLALIYAGFLMVIPGASSSRLEKGKKVLTNTFIGIAIVFFAWLAIDTIIKLLAGQNLTSGEPAQIQGYGPWNKIECRIIGLPAPVDRGRTTTATPTPSSAGSISALVGSGRIKLSPDASCKDILGNPVGPQTTYNEVVNRQPITVCKNGCTGKSVCEKRNDITINPNMVSALEAVAVPHCFTLNSVTTGSHSPSSLHYTGDAVDLAPCIVTPIGYENLRKFFADSSNRSRFNVKQVLCETRQGGKYANCLEAIPAAEIINHIHVEFKR